MTGEQENGVNYAKALSDAWNSFVDRQGFYFSSFAAPQNDLVSKAFMAGWITGLGSLSEDK